MRHVVANKLNVPRIRDAQPSLVRHAEKRNRQRVKANQARRDGIHGDRIGRCEQQVLHARDHGAGPGAVAGDCPVHDREDRRVQFLLHVQQVDEHLVHVLVGIVPHFTQESAERILH